VLCLDNVSDVVWWRWVSHFFFFFFLLLQSEAITFRSILASKGDARRTLHAVPDRKKSDGDNQFKVGDRVSLTLHTGRMVDGTVRAIVEKTDGVHLQVDYGNDETALVELWRVHPK